MSHLYLSNSSTAIMRELQCMTYNYVVLTLNVFLVYTCTLLLYILLFINIITSLFHNCFLSVTYCGLTTRLPINEDIHIHHIPMLLNLNAHV